MAGSVIYGAVTSLNGFCGIQVSTLPSRHRWSHSCAIPTIIWQTCSQRWVHAHRVRIVMDTFVTDCEKCAVDPFYAMNTAGAAVL